MHPACCARQHKLHAPPSNLSLMSHGLAMAGERFESCAAVICNQIVTMAVSGCKSKSGTGHTANVNVFVYSATVESRGFYRTRAGRSQRCPCRPQSCLLQCKAQPAEPAKLAQPQSQLRQSTARHLRAAGWWSAACGCGAAAGWSLLLARRWCR